jgi:hypothetical protein
MVLLTSVCCGRPTPGMVTMLPPGLAEKVGRASMIVCGPPMRCGVIPGRTRCGASPPGIDLIKPCLPEFADKFKKKKLRRLQDCEQRFYSYFYILLNFAQICRVNFFGNFGVKWYF